ncbi:hypothetical protein LEP1GSC072_3727 [Leptospira noguchii str. Bonito]|nr:hypothetical protein LEP1GSC072_3727 [Leptospira noguchii str. Bonito]
MLRSIGRRCALVSNAIRKKRFIEFFSLNFFGISTTIAVWQIHHFPIKKSFYKFFIYKTKTYLKNFKISM